MVRLRSPEPKTGPVAGRAAGVDDPPLPPENGDAGDAGVPEAEPVADAVAVGFGTALPGGRIRPSAVVTGSFTGATPLGSTDDLGSTLLPCTPNSSR
jgi:hypothetical protein